MTIDIPGLPFALTSSSEQAWVVDPVAATVTGAAPPLSDIFIDPGSGGTLTADPVLNAATLLGVPPEGDFQLSARVTVDFASTFDAGVVLLWFDERHWAKLCFEFSPDARPMIVSVVTQGVSDDANAFVVEGRSVWLRVSRIDRTFACHASMDGSSWRMIRYFRIDDVSPPLSIGFEAQSPTGDGCTVTFGDIHFVQQRLVDIRDGS